jgi:hypothetical protein
MLCAKQKEKRFLLFLHGKHNIKKTHSLHKLQSSILEKFKIFITIYELKYLTVMGPTVDSHKHLIIVTILILFMWANGDGYFAIGFESGGLIYVI